jgi:hypothetical protein
MSLPLSPTNGQTTTLNNITYVYSTSTNAWTRSTATTNVTNLNLTSPAPSTSTSTGALTVLGGVGVGGSVFASQIVGSAGFLSNNNTVTGNYTLATGTNAMSAGPIVLTTGSTITIPTGQRWTIL